jgi:hypothetical protein
MRAAAAAIVACLLLAGCASTSPAPEPVEASLVIPAPAIPERQCDQALINRIVAENGAKALSYPPHSAHRQVYLETIKTEFDSMLIGMPELPQGEWGKCMKMQTDAMQSYMLSREDSAGHPLRGNQ